MAVGLLSSALPLATRQKVDPAAIWDEEAEDEEGVKWGVMGVVSCIPWVNWLSWVFGAIDGGPPRYWAYAALYALPYLRSGLDVSDAASIAAIAVGIVHVQLERVASTEYEERPGGGAAPSSSLGGTLGDWLGQATGGGGTQADESAPPADPEQQIANAVVRIQKAPARIKKKIREAKLREDIQDLEEDARFEEEAAAARAQWEREAWEKKGGVGGGDEDGETTSRVQREREAWEKKGGVGGGEAGGGRVWGEAVGSTEERPVAREPVDGREEEDYKSDWL